MLEAVLEAMTMMASLERLTWMFVGVLLGLVIGMLPGLSGATGMAILLPFIYGLDPFSALGLLMGMSAVTTTGDSFTSILLGVPGTSGSQATIMDGYPMARQGKAATALGAAFTSSILGGVLGALTMLALIPIARPIVLRFGSPELLMLAILGLGAMAVFIRSAPLPGLLAAAIGLILGSVGGSAVGPGYRYAGELLYLFDGLPIAVLALGLFAIPEIVDLMAKRQSISRTSVEPSGIMEGVRSVFRSKLLVFRSAIIGTSLGMIPGVGGAVVDWFVYGVAQRSIRNNFFTKGDIRGVIAPESANNAKEGGALVPTLIFGIPGSSSMAILLGGLTLIGVQAGPRMVTENLSLTLSTVWTLVFANILGGMICLLLAKHIAKLSHFDMNTLGGVLIVIIVVAAYQSTRHWGDVIFLLATGSIAWLMKQVGWPRAPIIVGFALAPGIETTLHRTAFLYGWQFLLRPGVMVLLVLFLVMISQSVSTRPLRTAISRVRRR